MKIDPSNINNTKTADFQHISNDRRVGAGYESRANRITDNGFSSLQTKDVNNIIGILQVADKTISDILSNDNISLDSLLSRLKSASFFGKPIFSANQILQNSDGEVLFNANNIVDSMPNDKKDIYSFKKILRVEYKTIQDSLARLKSDILQDSSDVRLDRELLDSNKNLFINAHNTAGLASRIDALLA